MGWLLSTYDMPTGFNVATMHLAGEHTVVNTPDDLAGVVPQSAVSQALRWFQFRTDDRMKPVWGVS